MLHINLDTVEDLAEHVLLFNQLGHTCSKITVIIQRKVHFFPNCLAMALCVVSLLYLVPAMMSL